MIPDSAIFLRAVHRNRYLALHELIESLYESSQSSLKSKIVANLRDRNETSFSEMFTERLLPEFISEQIISLALISVWSIFEQSMDELAHEVWKVRPNHKEIWPKSFAGEKLEKWRQYFSATHNLPFLRQHEEALIKYVYKLRNVFAHGNGCLERTRAGHYNEEELKQAYKKVKDCATKNLIQYRVESTAGRVSIAIPAAQKIILLVADVDRLVTDRISHPDELSRKRSGHSLASDMDDLYV